MASVGVIGSGTWGTALAILLNGNGHKVQLWSASSRGGGKFISKQEASQLRGYANTGSN